MITALSDKPGCNQVLATHTNQKGEHWSEFCNKIVGDNDILCPHHRLLLDEEENERQEKARKRIIRRERKKAALEALKLSPLALHPEAEEGRTYPR